MWHNNMSPFFLCLEDTEDDEEYERRMMNCSMVYRLQDSDPPELIPVYDMCQRSPSKDILKTDEVCSLTLVDVTMATVF